MLEKLMKEVLHFIAKGGIYLGKFLEKFQFSLFEENPKLEPVGKLDEYPPEWKEQYLKDKDKAKKDLAKS
jgi:hypothetical protein